MSETPRAQCPTTLSDSVVGQSWAVRKGIDTPPAAWDNARRPPCPVCGHPTGDCTGEEAHRG